MSTDLHVIKPTHTAQAPYVRTTLRRAVAAQTAQNVWSSTEHINNAVNLVYGDELPDSGMWLLTKSELTTLAIALEWRRANRDSWNVGIHPDTVALYDEIEKKIREVHQDACRGEVQGWM